MNLFSVILVVLLLFQIRVLLHRIKYGWTYNVAPRIKVNQIKQALLVLENSSLGGYFYLSGGKKPSRIYFIKNQGISEWWFELLIRRKNEKIIDYLRSKQHHTDVGGMINPDILNKSFKDFYKINIGSNIEEIATSIINIFVEHFGCSPESKIFLKFFKIEVEKGIALD